MVVRQLVHNWNLPHVRREARGRLDQVGELPKKMVLNGFDRTIMKYHEI